MLKKEGTVVKKSVSSSGQLLLRRWGEKRRVTNADQLRTCGDDGAHFQTVSPGICSDFSHIFLHAKSRRERELEKRDD